MKKSGSQKKEYMFWLMVIVILVGLSVLSFVHYSKNLENLLMKKTEQELEHYTDHSILLIQNMIQQYYTEMDIIATFVSVNSGINDNEIMKMIREHNINETYGKIGVAGIDGTLYIGDNQPINISEEEYFQEAIQGKHAVSEVFKDQVSKEEEIVLSSPIWRKNEIVGIVCLMYNIKTFTNLIGNSQFQGMGATMVMQTNGKMISSYDGMEEYETFYEMLDTMDFKEKDGVRRFKERIKNGERGLITYYNKGKGRYIYFAPTGIKDWYIISLVLSQNINKQYSYINIQALKLMITNMIIYAAIMVALYMLYKKGSGIIKNNQLDVLTNLYNKQGAQIKAEHLLKEEGKKKRHAFFFIDLDNFKGVNDTMGHAVGDELLVKFSYYLKSCFRESDIVSRFGGDEFCVVMKDISSRRNAEWKAKEINEIFKQDMNYPVSSSVGIACYPEDGMDYQMLQQHADEALYYAKKKGKNQYCFYSDIEKNSEK